MPPSQTARGSRDWAIPLALYLVCQVLFLINIQFPRGLNFDEFHYVPAAKLFLQWKESANWEHPPLGKILMALGIGIWGDVPIGWRFMSTVFGAATVAGMYVWAKALFRDRGIALWVAAISVFNHLVYVQARIGMLDTFMTAFIVFGLAAFTAAWGERDAKRARWALYFAGACFGLGSSCKWFAVVPWFACAGLAGAMLLFQKWGVRLEGATRSEVSLFYSPELFRGVRRRDWLLALAVIPFLAYFVTFLPFFSIIPDYGIADFFASQKKMYEGQLRVVNQHPYMSQWMDWPTLRRPIWYAFDKEGAQQEWVRGVILLGNPLVMWGGLVALLITAWSFMRDRARESFLILMFYGALYGSWVAIPRKVSFYYYYYPAGLVLGLALAFVFHTCEVVPRKRFEFPGRWARWIFLASVIAVFFYFLPILAALKIQGDQFRRWMWFPGWV